MNDELHNVLSVDIQLNKEDYLKYDLEKINDWALAVRDILKSGGNSKNNQKMQQNLILAYCALAKLGITSYSIRKLSAEEMSIFQMATYKAVTAASALTGYISLLHPMVSVNYATLATDANLRLGIGWWFFDPILDNVERGTLLLHEVMHTVLGHYELKNLDMQLVNTAGDAIINQEIEFGDHEVMHLPQNEDKSDFIIFPRTIITQKYPQGMPNNQSFETYYHALEEERQKTPVPDQNSDICNSMSSQEESEFDKQNVEKAGEIEKELARNEALHKALDQENKTVGRNGSAFNSFILKALRPAKISWQKCLKNIIAKHCNTVIEGNMDYSYRRPSRRNFSNIFIRPGTISYLPKILIGCDSSGSMDEVDYRRLMSEIKEICKTVQHEKISFVTIDTKITTKQVVHKVQDIVLGAGGGTCMEKFYEYIHQLKASEKPDLSILCTDGYLGGVKEWTLLLNSIDKNIINIILITDRQGYDSFINLYGCNTPVKNTTIISIY